MKVIKFCSVTDEFGVLSNFTYYPVKIWPTTEYYFQAQKFNELNYREKITKAKAPSVAVIVGHDRKQKIRNDRDSIKCNIMKKALFTKFTQHEALQEDTEEAKFKEHTENNSYWG